MDKALAGVLRGAYATRGLNQAELVEKTGIKAPTMQRIMAGKTTITIGQFYALADAIGWKRPVQYLEEAEGLLAFDRG